MGLYTDRHLMLRVPKTGTTWARDCILALGGQQVVRAQHAPRMWFQEHHPDLFEGRLVFTAVRNPWDWYPSFYLHLCRIEARSPSNFKLWLARVAHAEDHRPVRNPPTIDMFWLSEGKGRRGLCTACHDYVTGGPVDAYVFTDRLPEGLQELLGEVTALDDVALNSRRLNGPQGYTTVPYESLYDPEMIGWVEVADAGLIRRFGFEPWQPSRSAVVYA